MRSSGTDRERFREAPLRRGAGKGEVLRELISRRRPAALDSSRSRGRGEGERFRDGRGAAFLPMFSAPKTPR